MAGEEDNQFLWQSTSVIIKVEAAGMCVWHKHHLLYLMPFWGQNMNLPSTVFEYFNQTNGKGKKVLLAFSFARKVVESYVRNVIEWDGVGACGSPAQKNIFKSTKITSSCERIYEINGVTQGINIYIYQFHTQTSWSTVINSPFSARDYFLFFFFYETKILWGLS